jgi:hypothetical protein
MNKTLIVLVMVSASLIQGISSADAQEIPANIRNIIEGIIDAPTTPRDSGKTPSFYLDGAQSRAMNLARQAAEHANGGLNDYRAERSMYGPANQAPFKNNGNGTLTFIFLGGRPTEPPTIQSVVTVSLKEDLVSMDYNGPIQFTRY